MRTPERSPIHTSSRSLAEKAASAVRILSKKEHQGYRGPRAFERSPVRRSPRSDRPLAEKAASALRILSKRDTSGSKNERERRVRDMAEEREGEKRDQILRVESHLDSHREGHRTYRRVVVSQSRSSSPPQAVRDRSRPSYAEVLLKSSPAGVSRDLKGQTVMENDDEWTKVGRKRQREKDMAVIPKGFRIAKDGNLEPICHNCGVWGHWHGSCTEETKCYNCKGKGHISRLCPLSSRRKESISPKFSMMKNVKKGETSVANEVVGIKERWVEPARVKIDHPPMSEEMSKCLNLSVVATVVQGDATEQQIREELRKRWPKSVEWDWKVKCINDKNFVVSCDTKERVRCLLQRRSMNTSAFLVNFKRWSVDVGVWKGEKEGLRSYWLKVHNLPLSCWNDYGFRQLVQSFGWYEEMDYVTCYAKRFDYARIRVSTLDDTDVPAFVFLDLDHRWFKVTFAIESRTDVYRRKSVKETMDEWELQKEKADREDEEGPSDHLCQDQRQSSSGWREERHVGGAHKGKSIMQDPTPHVGGSSADSVQDSAKSMDWTVQQDRDVQQDPLKVKAIAVRKEPDIKTTPRPAYPDVALIPSRDEVILKQENVNELMVTTFFNILKGDASDLSESQLTNLMGLFKNSGDGPSNGPGNEQGEIVLSSSGPIFQHGSNLGLIQVEGTLGESKVDQKQTEPLQSERVEKKSHKNKEGKEGLEDEDQSLDETFFEEADELLRSRTKKDDRTVDDIIEALRTDGEGDSDSGEQLEAEEMKEQKETTPINTSKKTCRKGEDGSYKRKSIAHEELRRSARQLKRTGGVPLTSDEMMEKAATAKLPASTCEGIMFPKFSIIDCLPDNFVLQLAEIFGVNLGSNKMQQMSNLRIIREWLRQKE